MAQTKVKLISDGVIDVDHLASGHGITTDNIGEGSNLYYTDARVSTYLSTNNYATEGYVTTAVSDLVAAAPSTLDTLNELAAALGDDPNFATTVTNSIATKLPLAGGTLTGDLGIGGSPNTKLEVNTDTNNDGITLNGSTANLRFNIKNDLVTSGQRAFSMMMSGSYPALIFQALDNSYGFVRNIMAIEHGGEVGIGTITPSYTLDVNGSSHCVNGYVDNAIFHTGDTNTYLQFHEQDQFRVVTGGVERFEVSNAQTYIQNVLVCNDFVGIGTTSPDTKLHVQVASGGAIFETTSGDFDFRFRESGVNKFNLGYMASDDSMTMYNNQIGQHQMYWKSNGNVGIGLTNPSQKLHVSGSAVVTGNLGIGTTSPSQPLVVNQPNHNDDTVGYDGSTILWRLRNEVVSGNPTGRLNLYSNGGSTIQLESSPGRTTYFNAGDVGIGTTSPEKMLQLGKSDGTNQGSLRIYHDASGDYVDYFGYGIEFSRDYNYIRPDQTSGRILLIGNDSLYWPEIQQHANEHNWYNASGSFAMRLRSNGSLGIGTTSADHKFHVNGSTTNIVAHFQSTDSIGGIKLSDSTGNVELTTSSSDGFDVRPNGGSPVFRINSNGNVGIGDSNPGNKLEVNGTTRTHNIVLSNSSNSSNTMVETYRDQHKRTFVSDISFTYTGQGFYYFNLVFPQSGGYGYDLKLFTGRSGNWRNFGYIKHQGYLYWEPDGDFQHVADGGFDIASSYAGGISANVNSYYGANNITDTSAGSLNYSYYIVRYRVYFPDNTTGSNGYLKVHLNTYGYNGTSVYFLKA